ncbi:Craniofacial development protein 2 [Stylophora pistillata]|uniref:Craniofacial development protein 2 n=1 Tax=Stylophora pistillata TaxID=50429 RepID=A0A2B4RCB7_STYPI|nr:Craniofacial development protein 2 [Stylophora pistillata]
MSWCFNIHRTQFEIRNDLLTKLTEQPVGINERLMTLRIALEKNQNATVISAYAPTPNDEEEVKKAFYADLDELISATPAQGKLILLGDLNARVGRDHNIWEASYKTCSSTAFTSQKIALQVVPVRVEGENGNLVSTWALLDTGSEESFIAKSTADKLRLRVKNFESLAVCTLTGESTVRVGRVDLAVLSMEGPEGHRIEIKDVKVVEHLHVNMSRPQDLTKWEHLNDIPPPEIGGGEVTLLIGANVPEAHIHEEVRVGGVGEPYAVRTLFGLAIMGPLNGNIRSQFNKANVNFLRYGNETLDQQMSQFLGLENIDSIFSSRKGMSVQDREALSKLNSSARLVAGHYEVGKLWKHESPWLPNNRKTAVARLHSLRRRLCADEQLCCKYQNFMDDLLTKGYARKLT